MYSPYFFKDNFCENKNKFKNQEKQNSVNNETPIPETDNKSMAFKIENINHSTGKNIVTSPENNKRFSQLVSERIRKFKEFCYTVASAYFKEEVV